MSFFDKIKAGLQKTKQSTGEAFNAVFAAFREVDEDLLADLEDALIMADIGAYTASEAIDELRKQSKRKNLQTKEEVIDCLARILADKMAPNDGLKLDTRPSVILVVGVNGVGKTTSIGKLGAKLTAEGKKVLFAAGDTFRAAAADQLTIWAKRAGADIVRHNEGADPSAVIFDALTAAKARNVDVVICDTAGRLHNKENLMKELEKMHRVIARELPDASVETLLVLDATTGQNAISQAEGFNSVTRLTGLILTKLDGTAKGGIAIHISSSMEIPVKFIGVGEKVDDLLEFDAYEFTRAFFDDRNGEETGKEEEA
jgi:signal recognition particle-docking protein FtsY